MALGIVTRDRALLVRKAINSALNQNVDDLSIWVINDSSTDSTRQIASEYPRITWIDWALPRGCIAAREYLMRRISADYFVSLDDDAWFLEGDEISIAAKYLEENQSIGAVAFDILSPDRPQPGSRTNPRTVATFIGCGHMIRLSAARQAGFYEMSPGLYGAEEKDLCLRLLDAGYSTALLPGVHVWHDKTTLERNISMQHCSGVCNDLVMSFRRTPFWLLPATMLFKFYRHWMFSIQNHLLRPCLAGFRLFLRSMPSVWHSRRPVRTATLQRFVRLTRS